MAKRTFYDILGIGKTASINEVKHAYRELAKRYHPDVNSGADAAKKFKEVHTAYAILSNALERKIYDESLLSDKIPKAVFTSPQATYRSPQPSQSQTTTRQRTYTATKPDAEEVRKQEEIRKHRRHLIIQAIARIVLHTLGSLFAGYLIISMLQIIQLSTLKIGWISLAQFGGILAGLIIGFIWSIDRYFKIETFILNPYKRKMFKHFRTASFALAILYIAAFFWDTMIPGSLNLPSWVTILFLLFMVLLGATFASDGEMRNRFAKGKILEIVVIFWHNLMIGLAGGVLGFVIGIIFFILDSKSVSLLYLSSTFGFIFAVLLGSVTPDGLEKITEKINQFTRSMLYAILLLLAFALGIGAGVMLGLFFK